MEHPVKASSAFSSYCRFTVGLPDSPDRPGRVEISADGDSHLQYRHQYLARLLGSDHDQRGAAAPTRYLAIPRTVGDDPGDTTTWRQELICRQDHPAQWAIRSHDRWSDHGLDLSTR